MKLEIDVQEGTISNTELLKLLEYALCFDYTKDTITNDGTVGHYYFAYSGELRWKKAPIPGNVYKAFTTLRNYLIGE